MNATSARTRPETTADGRYVVIDGRRWRATDPAIPDALRQQLVDELMSARRAVGAAVRSARAGDRDGVAEAAARKRVGDAKVALGERGDPWWAPTPAGTRCRIAATARALLRHRDVGASICPSEVARVVGGDDWRELMPTVRAVADDLAEAGEFIATAGDEVVDARTWAGPIRLRRGDRFDETTT